MHAATQPSLVQIGDGFGGGVVDDDRRAPGAFGGGLDVSHESAQVHRFDRRVKRARVPVLDALGDRLVHLRVNEAGVAVGDDHRLAVGGARQAQVQARAQEAGRAGSHLLHRDLADQAGADEADVKGNLQRGVTRGVRQRRVIGCSREVPKRVTTRTCRRRGLGIVPTSHRRGIRAHAPSSSQRTRSWKRGGARS